MFGELKNKFLIIFFVSQLFIQLSSLPQVRQMLKLIILLLSLTLVSTADISTVYISAVYQCYLTFSYRTDSKQYLLDNCTYFVTGYSNQPTTSNEFSSCYNFCCPGLVQPANKTINDMQICIDTYANKPFSVTLIGILIGIFLLLILVIIPCCFGKDGYYSRIKDYLKKCCHQQQQKQEEEDFIASLKLMKSNQRLKGQENKNKNFRQTGSLYILDDTSNRVLIRGDSLDSIPSEQRKCCICTKGKCNLRLNCLHYYHNNCLQGRKLQKCEQCSSVQIYPIAVFCSICENRFNQMENINFENTYICQLCDQK